MKITIKDFEIVGNRTKFVKPSTMIVNGVEYLVYCTKTMDNGDGTLTIELEASENGIVAKVKEEKKMLNVEKYLNTIKEEIAKEACASKSCLVAKVRGDERPDCYDRTCRDCEDASMDWLFSEYEPPLLENGDGLKPGDWIMVRDNDRDNWNKRRFACYRNYWFYVVKEGSQFYATGTTIVGYVQARLPEEGE